MKGFHKRESPGIDYRKSQQQFATSVCGKEVSTSSPTVSIQNFLLSYMAFNSFNLFTLFIAGTPFDFSWVLSLRVNDSRVASFTFLIKCDCVVLLHGVELFKMLKEKKKKKERL